MPTGLKSLRVTTAGSLIKGVEAVEILIQQFPNAVDGFEHFVLSGRGSGSLVLCLHDEEAICRAVKMESVDPSILFAIRDRLNCIHIVQRTHAYQRISCQ